MAAITPFSQPRQYSQSMTATAVVRQSLVEANSITGAIEMSHAGMCHATFAFRIILMVL